MSAASLERRLQRLCEHIDAERGQRDGIAARIDAGLDPDRAIARRIAFVLSSALAATGHSAYAPLDMQVSTILRDITDSPNARLARSICTAFASVELPVNAVTLHSSEIPSV